MLGSAEFSNFFTKLAANDYVVFLSSWYPFLSAKLGWAKRYG